MPACLKLKFAFLISVCCLFFFSASFSQSQKFIVTTRFLGLKDGLAGKQVNCGMQDSKGFIWFGTNHGLQRYDGKNFRLFSKEKSGMQDNNVIQIFEDQNNLLWILYGTSGTDRYFNGKTDVLDLNTHEIKSVANKFGSAIPFSEKDIAAFKANEKREMIFVVRTKSSLSDLWHYARATGFKKIMQGHEIGTAYLRIIYKDKLIMLNIENNRIVILNENGSNAHYFNSSDDIRGLFCLGINAQSTPFIIESAKTLEAGQRYAAPFISEITKNGSVKKISNQYFDFIKGSVNQMEYYTACDPYSGQMILSQYNNGLSLFDGSNYILLMDSAELKANNFFRMRGFFSTGNNRYWLCTDYGVYIFTIKPNNFTHLLSNDVIKFPVGTDHQSRSIYADDTAIYANCWNGFFRINKNNQDGYIYNHIAGKDTIGLGDGFYYDGIYFWHNGPNNKIIRWNPTYGKFDFFYSENSGVWSGTTLRNGKLIIGQIAGISVFENNSFSRLKKCDGSDYAGWFYQFFYDIDSTLWAVANNGLYKIENNNCISAHYSADEKDSAFRIPFSDIHYVHQDKDKNFWMATNGAGLIKWNRTQNTFEQFTVADGLSSNVLYAVLEDEKGFFWMSSEYGIMRFDPLSHSVKTYTTDDGLTDNEFNRISYFKAVDGRMFFGGLNGINAFYSKDFLSDTTAFNAPLRVVSYNQFNGEKEILVDRTNELAQNNSITLNPGDKFFTLEFQLLDFEEGKHRFAYKIEGVDKDWIYTAENSIRLSGLPYGNFILCVKGQNMDGQWSGDELKIPLHVLTPFYLQWWFVLFSFAVIVLAVLFFFRWRTNQLLKAKTALEITVGERTEQLRISLGEKEVLLKEIHHRVKNNLQVIVSLLDMHQKKIDSPVLQHSFIEAKTNVRSISLIHENLYRHENLGGVDVNSFVNDLIKQVSTVFNPTKKQIDFICDVPQMQLDIETTVPLGLILNELLTNSFKYTFDKVDRMKIAVAIKKTDDEAYELIYCDNGLGLPKDFELKKTNTLGMNLIKDLSRQIGGSVNYKFENGSCFTVKFLSLKGRKKVD